MRPVSVRSSFVELRALDAGNGVADLGVISEVEGDEAAMMDEIELNCIVLVKNCLPSYIVAGSKTPEG